MALAPKPQPNLNPTDQCYQPEICLSTGLALTCGPSHRLCYLLPGTDTIRPLHSLFWWWWWHHAGFCHALNTQPRSAALS